MSRAKRLQLVLDMAEHVEQKAAGAYQMARDLWQEDQLKLEQLQRYYDDYEASFSGSSRALRAEDIVRQRGFLQQLSEAKHQQRQTIQRRSAVAEHKKQAWHKAHLKHKALRELVTRLQCEESNELSRKEEKLMDDWCSQLRRNNTDGRPGL